MISKGSDEGWVPQRIFNIGGVEVGGRIGELPTALIGCIFYDRHRIVKDPKRGVFERGAAERLVQRQAELSEATGNPHMLDVIASTPEAMRRYIDFVADLTEAPLLIDSSIPEVRIAGLEHAAEVGLLERTVYNSLSYATTEEELSRIREAGLKNAVILAFNPRYLWPRGVVPFLRGEKYGPSPLRRAMEQGGLERVLIDVGVLDVPSIGLTMESVERVKRELGLPAGAGPSNAVLDWRQVRRLGPRAKEVCLPGSILLTQCAGADFAIYGPMKYAETVFPAVAMADAILAYRAMRHGVRPRTKRHPLYRLPFH